MLPGYSSFNNPVQSALGFPLLDRTPRPKVTSDGKSGREPEAGAGAEAMGVCLLLNGSLSLVSYSTTSPGMTHRELTLPTPIHY